MTQFRPATQVIAHTWRGETYDLTGDLMSWNRGKMLSQPQGTFVLSLTGRRDKRGLTWADKLRAMDYIEIRASRQGKKVNGRLPIILRGFLDVTPDALQFAQTGGPSEPRVVLTGRDSSKLLLEWQILYLFTQNTLKKGGNLAAIQAQSQGFGLFYNFHLPFLPTSITAFFKDAFAKLVDPIYDGLRGYHYAELPHLVGDFHFPDYAMSSMNVLSYTGSYWNLFEYFSSPPFGELFVLDTEEAPTLVSRMTPYQTITGETPFPGTPLGVSVDIENEPAVNVDRSDSDVYTYFLTYGASTQMVNLTIPTFITQKGNGVQTEKANLYGIRPLEVDTSWVAEYDANETGKPNTQALAIASELNQWLLATQGDNELWYNGTVLCHGFEGYQIGTYVRDPYNGRIYYLAGINDTFDAQANTWSATLTVVRGRDEGG